jgi:hypothetical protein
MRDVEEAGPQLRTGRRLRQRCRGRHHGVEEGQGQRRTRALQHGSPGNVLLEDEHRIVS